MEKYIKAEMEVVVFEAEDVITTSGTCEYDGSDPFEGEWVCIMGTSR